MSTDNTPENPAVRDGTDRPVAQSSNLVTWVGSLLLGIYFLALATISFYLLVATWPVINTKAAAGFADFSFFVWGPFAAPSDHRLFLTVIAAGVLGSLIHSITSFADYVGNRSLDRSWIWWLVLRAPVGVALALLFYLVLRGGLIVPSMPNGSADTDTTHLLNPYGIAAISALAGMFSKQATDKLREIFDTLFRTREPVNRADPLALNKPVVSRTDPSRLAVGGTLTLNVFGHGFERDCTALVSGKARDVQFVSETRLVLTLLAEDVAAKAELQLIVNNPGPAGAGSDPYPVPVDGP
jgi:hypothetical protein